MTVFFYAMLKAAREKMTPTELEVAFELARLADQGRQSAIDALRKLVDEVLFERPLRIEESSQVHVAIAE
jgi:hypothetical protein